MVAKAAIFFVPTTSEARQVFIFGDAFGPGCYRFATLIPSGLPPAASLSRAQFRHVLALYAQCTVVLAPSMVYEAVPAIDGAARASPLAASGNHFGAVIK